MVLASASAGSFAFPFSVSSYQSQQSIIMLLRRIMHSFYRFTELVNTMKRIPKHNYQPSSPSQFHQAYKNIHLLAIIHGSSEVDNS